MPRAEEEWISIADKTFDFWQFTNAAGAMDENIFLSFTQKTVVLNITTIRDSAA